MNHRQKLLGLGMAAITVAILLLLSAVTWARLSSAKTVPLHQRDTELCVRHESLGAATAVLVDVTDALTREHQTHLRAVLQQLKRQTPVNGKVVMVALTPTLEPRPLSLLFAGCNPGTKSGNAFLDHPAVAPVDRLWARHYAAPLDAAFAKVTGLPPSPEASPILEGITALTARADFDRLVPRRKLIVITDGLQLTPGVYSHFRGGDLWAAYQSSALPALTQADLAGVEVEVVYLLRPQFAVRQTEAHRAFLVRWFKSRGAPKVNLRGVAFQLAGDRP
jgi:hypothetical protein